MVRLVIKRLYLKPNYTIGKLYVNGEYICDTLEDRVRDLANEPKVYGETAIPYGSYSVEMTISPRFKDKVWAIPYGGIVPAIVDVPHFSGVRIHCGNSEKQTYGCPLVGYNKVRGRLVDSVAAYKKLMDVYLMTAYKAGEPITIDIK